MCVLCYPVSIHKLQLLSTGRPISSFVLNNILCNCLCKKISVFLVFSILSNVFSSITYYII